MTFFVQKSTFLQKKFVVSKISSTFAVRLGNDLIYRGVEQW